MYLSEVGFYCSGIYTCVGTVYTYKLTKKTIENRVEAVSTEVFMLLKNLRHA